MRNFSIYKSMSQFSNSSFSFSDYLSFLLFVLSTIAAALPCCKLGFDCEKRLNIFLQKSCRTIQHHGRSQKYILWNQDYTDLKASCEKRQSLEQFSMEGEKNDTNYFTLWTTHLFTVEMGPKTTRAYFWLVVYKRRTRLWPRYFLTWRAKIWNFKEKFSNAKPKPKMAAQTQPERQKFDMTQPGSKNFDTNPSLI